MWHIVKGDLNNLKSRLDKLMGFKSSNRELAMLGAMALFALVSFMAAGTEQHPYHTTSVEHWIELHR